MSDLPSLLKSPLSLTCQAGPGLMPTGAAASTVRPFISQMPGVPSSFCHRMSAGPSKLKSPVPLMCQAGPGLVPTGLTETAVRPFISQMPGVPSSFCHRMSDLPSKSKSASPLTCQLGPGLVPTGLVASGVKPFISQMPGVPSLFCHRMSEALLLKVPLKSCGLQMPYKVASMPQSSRLPEPAKKSSRTNRVQVVLSIHLPAKLASRVAAPLGAGWLMTRPGDTPVQLLLVSTSPRSVGRYVPGAMPPVDGNNAAPKSAIV